MMAMDHGGKREGSGRKAIGITRKISLTLDDDTWEYIDGIKERGFSYSEIIRNLLDAYFSCSHCQAELIDVEEE